MIKYIIRQYIVANFVKMVSSGNIDTVVMKIVARLKTFLNTILHVMIHEIKIIHMLNFGVRKSIQVVKWNKQLFSQIQSVKIRYFKHFILIQINPVL